MSILTVNMIIINRRDDVSVPICLIDYDQSVNWPPKNIVFEKMIFSRKHSRSRSRPWPIANRSILFNKFFLHFPQWKAIQLSACGSRQSECHYIVTNIRCRHQKSRAFTFFFVHGEWDARTRATVKWTLCLVWSMDLHRLFIEDINGKYFSLSKRLH